MNFIRKGRIFVNYTDNEFLEDLGMGREVEFIYNGEKYYISNRGFWRFYDNTSEIRRELYFGGMGVN